jgi:hypothetical protein
MQTEEEKRSEEEKIALFCFFGFGAVCQLHPFISVFHLYFAGVGKRRASYLHAN